VRLGQLYPCDGALDKALPRCAMMETEGAGYGMSASSRPIEGGYIPDATVRFDAAISTTVGIRSKANAPEIDVPRARRS